MILYGSDTSPYVRRIRIYCLRHDITLDYRKLDIFSEEGRAILHQHNPARKLPFLLADDQAVLDSNVIARYLQQKFSLPHLNWAQENLLTIINACNDSLVELLLCQRSEFDIQDDKLFFNLQRGRIAETLRVLDQSCHETVFLNCEYLQISLYCLLDWIRFRNLFDLTPYTALEQFYDQWQPQDEARLTDPRA
ncbi:glutathione S-transferase family protein [Pseudoalteromonas sp. McH1-42]|uniref:glutathione S-transferase family protein n=1 Tax=Pseudoalteromonas sp. McH1-42 TaxID=2917752 RepID=UPI001EF44355|nr:glutathione S-transferase family protein [Pseudoalteromonas sp. McH1-42]MCG7563196.1 glutathione S-transferase family protein [Pseudoalteromonas sp. McH1-42]